MLDHGGLLSFRDTNLSLAECQANPETAWKKWKDDEARSRYIIFLPLLVSADNCRLVASWVLVDQELSLFMDVAPILSISSVMTIMPDMDVLWQAKTANEWLKAYDSHKPRMTLCDLFRFFLDGGLSNPNVQLSPIQLRILLHPLQTLTVHLRQLIRCYPKGTNSRKGTHAVNKSALHSRFEEVQSLLKQWYTLNVRSPRDREEDHVVTSANLINFHLISLNAVICIPEIEQYASRDVPEPQSPSLQGSCTEHVEEIFFHCGQVLRLLRTITVAMRPPWWPAAVYRVALASWMTSMANAKARSLLSSLSREAHQPPLVLDSLLPENPSIMRYLNCGEGQPMFTKGDGTMVSLGEPQRILTHCVELLSGVHSTSFKEGIQSKLVRLAERWQYWKYE